MDSNQTWYEASLVCVHSFLWIWASSETSKITPLLCLYLVKCFQLKVNFLLHITSMNVHGFHPNSNRVTSTMCSSYPVKMSKIWGFKKYHLLSVCFSAKKCIFGSFITSMNVHGFHPNSNRVTPTMSSSYPVKMSKIWGNKKYHLLWCFHWQSLRSVTLGSLITTMSVHGFQPNLAWSIPTVPSFIPVNMSKIWGFKNFTFVLSNFFCVKIFY